MKACSQCGKDSLDAERDKSPLQLCAECFRLDQILQQRDDRLQDLLKIIRDTLRKIEEEELTESCDNVDEIMAEISWRMGCG